LRLIDACVEAVFFWARLKSRALPQALSRSGAALRRAGEDTRPYADIGDFKAALLGMIRGAKCEENA